eukprot:gene29175-35208_t
MSHTDDGSTNGCMEENEGILDELFIFEKETIHRSAVGSPTNASPLTETLEHSPVPTKKEEASTIDIAGLLQERADEELTPKRISSIAAALQDLTPKIASFAPNNDSASKPLFLQLRKSTASLCEEFIRHLRWLTKESAPQLKVTTNAVDHSSSQRPTTSLQLAPAFASSPLLKKPVLMPVPRKAKVTEAPSLAKSAGPTTSTHALLDFKNVPLILARSTSAPAASSLVQPTQRATQSSEKAARENRVTSESDVEDIDNAADYLNSSSSSIEEPGIAKSKKPRSSIVNQALHKLEQNKPYRSFMIKVEGKRYDCTICGDYFGVVSIKPTFLTEHRKMVEFCFCDKRRLANQADYIYCHVGTSCNHLVHKHCIRNFSSIREVDYPSQLSHYVCHMCEKGPQMRQSPRPVRDDSECFWIEDDLDNELEEDGNGGYKAEEKHQARKMWQVKSRKESEEEERLRKKARPQVMYYGTAGTAEPKKEEDLEITFIPNVAFEAGKTDYIVTLSVGEKLYYVHLNHKIGGSTFGCHGFPTVLPNDSIPHTVAKQLKSKLCFCTDRVIGPHWLQNYYVFCKDGTTCNHLTHRNCLRDYHTMKERQLSSVFTPNF